MQKNLFDIIPKNFFLPLSCSNRHFYADCIVDLQDYVSKNIDGLPKEDVLSIIEQCLKLYGSSVIAEADDFEDDTASRRLDRPLTKEMVFRKLDTCGWFSTEPSEDGRTVLVTMPNYAEEQILALRRMTTEKKFYLGGYAHNIQDELVRTLDPNTKHPFQGALFSAWENAKSLSQSIRAIRNSLRKEVSKILSSAQDYDTALKNYNAFMDRAVSGDIYQLQVSEGIDAELKQDVQSKIDAINFRDENNQEQMALFNRIITDIMDFYPDIEDEEEARRTLEDCLSAIMDCLGVSYDEKMSSIRATQCKYLNNAMTKITMICTEDNMVEHDINLLALALGDMDSEEFEEWELFRSGGQKNHHMFQPFGACYIDENSLYKPRVRRNDEAADEILLDEPESPVEFTNKDRKEINPRLAAKALNKWMQVQLKGREQIRSDEIRLDTTEDFEKLIAVAISGDNAHVEYEATFDPGGQTVSVGKFTMPVFTLGARQKQKG